MRKEGAFGDDQKAELLSQPTNFREQIATPLVKRDHTTAILNHDCSAIGHVLLNHVANDEKRRIHFHFWRHAMPEDKFSVVAGVYKEAVPLTLRYFFNHHRIGEIVGDVAVENKIANHLLKRAGYTPSEIVQASYLGQDAEYNRYRLKPV